MNTTSFPSLHRRDGSTTMDDFHGAAQEIGTFPGSDVPDSSWYIPEDLRPYYTTAPLESYALLEKIIKNIHAAHASDLAAKGLWRDIPDVEKIRTEFLVGRGGFQVPHAFSTYFADQFPLTIHHERIERARKALGKKQADERTKAEHTCEVCGAVGSRRSFPGLSVAPEIGTRAKDVLHHGEIIVSIVACRPCQRVLEVEAARSYGKKTLASGLTRAEAVAAILDV